jgi:predicted nucleotidyltransferase component of viral defense system
VLDVRSLEPLEMIAEKVRAAFQRAKVRDLYDLYSFAARPFDGELLRRLAVLKLWQVRDPFDPDAFFERLETADYEWEDLDRLIRASMRVDPAELLAAVRSRFAMLRDLSALERQVVADATSGWNEPLADRLRRDILARFQP